MKPGNPSMDAMEQQRRMAEVEQARKASLENAKSQIGIIESQLDRFFENGDGGYAISPDGTLTYEAGDLELEPHEIEFLREVQERLTSLYQAIHKNT